MSFSKEKKEGNVVAYIQRREVIIDTGEQILSKNEKIKLESKTKAVNGFYEVVYISDEFCNSPDKAFAVLRAEDPPENHSGILVFQADFFEK
jgi:hypothetical protein